MRRKLYRGFHTNGSVKKGIEFIDDDISMRNRKIVWKTGKPDKEILYRNGVWIYGTPCEPHNAGLCVNSKPMNKYKSKKRNERRARRRNNRVELNRFCKKMNWS